MAFANYEVERSSYDDCTSSIPYSHRQGIMNRMSDHENNDIGSERMVLEEENNMPASDQEVPEDSNKNDEANESSTALDAALLLTSLASNSNIIIPKAETTSQDCVRSPRFSQLCSMLESEYQHEFEDQNNHTENDSNAISEYAETDNSVNKMEDKNVRIRAVSVDSSGLAYPPYESLMDYINDHPTMLNSQKSDQEGRAMTISPPVSPKLSAIPKVPADFISTRHAKSHSQNCKRQRSKPILDPRKRFCLRKQQQQLHEQKQTRNKRMIHEDVSALSSLIRHDDSHMEKVHSASSSKGHLQPSLTSSLSGQINTTILRRKFSWKNYPELEAFLIANREEYLRHSALNYTTQQKQYNNRLTERLIELATTHGYIFDEEAFSFVTVRDRIRCYYKSYVQSSKKRGLIIGYAARKAGLLTEDDLQKSAGIEGRIIVPEV